MVIPYPNFSNYLNSVREFCLKAPVYPRSYLLISIVLTVLFAYDGVTKLFDPKAFAEIISTYDLVPETFLPVVVIVFPALKSLSDWFRPSMGNGVSRRGGFKEILRFT